MKEEVKLFGENLENYRFAWEKKEFFPKLKRLYSPKNWKTIRLSIRLYNKLDTLKKNSNKYKIALSALGYLILCFDMVPDFLPVFGLLDDSIAIMMALKYINKT